MPYVDFSITCPHCGETIHYDHQPADRIFHRPCRSCKKTIKFRTKKGKVIRAKK